MPQRTSLKGMIAQTVNSALKVGDLALVRASTLDRSFRLPDDAAEPVALPPGAEQELAAGNPRLRDLQRIYRAMNDHPTRRSSLWTEAFVGEIALHQFRAHNAYLWQEAVTPSQKLHWLLVGYYTAAIDRLGLLDRMSEDGAFGAYRFRFMNRYFGSKDLLDSIGEINFLERTIGISNRLPLRVLDIGAGYGRLMHRLVEAWPDGVSGYCVDAIPESTFLCEYYTRFRGLADKVEVVSLDRIDAAFADQRVDLVTNVHSFSECRLEAIRWWLDLAVRVRARHLFIVPNAYHNGGTQLLSREADGTFLDFRPEIEQRGFRLVQADQKYRDDSFTPFGINTYQYLFERADAG
jgi:SAM-dependent methyltransferase